MLLLLQLIETEIN